METKTVTLNKESVLLLSKSCPRGKTDVYAFAYERRW